MTDVHAVDAAVSSTSDAAGVSTRRSGKPAALRRSASCQKAGGRAPASCRISFRTPGELLQRPLDPHEHILAAGAAHISSPEGCSETAGRHISAPCSPHPRATGAPVAWLFEHVAKDDCRDPVVDWLMFPANVEVHRPGAIGQTRQSAGSVGTDRQAIRFWRGGGAKWGWGSAPRGEAGRQCGLMR